MPKIYRPALCAVVSIMLAACGGGGSDSGSPTVTSTPAAPTNSSLTNLEYDETFQTYSTVLTANISGFSFTGTNVSSRNYGSGATVTYDKSADSYRINISYGGANTSQTFLPSDISGSSNSQVTIYEKTSGSTDHTLGIYNPGDPSLNLSYVTYGAWLGIQGSSSFDTAYFIFGVPTATEDMPASGSATYYGTAEGYVEQSGSLYIIAGDMSLDVNFSNGTLTGDFTDLQRQNILTASISNYGFTASGSISSTQFSGTVTGVDFSASGTWQGGFFGPGAVEAGGTWIIDNNGHQSIGGFVAQQ